MKMMMPAVMIDEHCQLQSTSLTPAADLDRPTILPTVPSSSTVRTSTRCLADASPHWLNI